MTIIIGLETEKGIMMGCDSAVSSGYTIHTKKQSKVFRNGEFTLGSCGSTRMSDLLRYSLNVTPKSDTQGNTKYMYTTFINAVRDCFKEGGFKKVDNNVESFGNSSFIVGYKKNLYVVDSGFEINSFTDGYMCEGSGYEVANGSMFSTAHLSPKQRIKQALKAAEYFVPSCRGPFTIIKNY